VYLDDFQSSVVRIGEHIHSIYFAYNMPEDDLLDEEFYRGRRRGRGNWSQAQQQQQ
jgi:hypothetical protein